MNKNKNENENENDLPPGYHIRKYERGWYVTWGDGMTGYMGAAFDECVLDDHGYLVCKWLRFTEGFRPHPEQRQVKRYPTRAAAKLAIELIERQPLTGRTFS